MPLQRWEVLILLQENWIVKMIKFSDKALQEFENYKFIFDNPKSALIPTLYLAQREFGHLSSEVIDYVGSLLQLTSAKVLQVASFYTMLHKKPIGKYEIQVCLNISCALFRARELFSHMKKRLNISDGETTDDKKFTLCRVECLGACDKAPVVRINDEYHYTITPEKIDQLLEKCK